MDRTVFSPNDHLLFFARQVLLVEGPVDSYGVQRIAALLDLRMPHLTVISCNGKGKIVHYATVCDAFEIPFYTLYDLDGDDGTMGNAESVENKNLKTALASHSTTELSTSFERLLGLSINAERKATKASDLLDSMSAVQIPKELEKAVRSISAWYTGDAIEEAPLDLFHQAK